MLFASLKSFRRPCISMLLNFLFIVIGYPLDDPIDLTMNSMLVELTDQTAQYR